MLKLQESLSWMMSRRHAAMRRERESVDRVGIRESLESAGGIRLDDDSGNIEDSVAVGRRKEFRIEEMDFVR